jgi:hypothetical protein
MRNFCLGEILDKEFKRMITRMINKIKEYTYKHLKKFQEDIHKDNAGYKKGIQERYRAGQQ